MPDTHKTCRVSDLLVIVIDEDHNTQEEMCDMLRQLGVSRLLCSDDPQYAIDLLSDPHNQHQIDLLVTNCQSSKLPLSGLIKGVKTLKPDTIIITYSSCEDPTTHARALVIGASDYFKKEPGYERRVNQKLTAWINIATRNCELCSLGEP